MSVSRPEKIPGICVAVKQDEFEELYQKKIPIWRAFWSLLLMEGTDMRGRKPSLARPQVELQRKIKNKMSTLVKEEEMLVDLYSEAAEAARKTEEEFKSKMAVLLEQIEKDKKLLKEYNEEKFTSNSQ